MDYQLSHATMIVVGTMLWSFGSATGDFLAGCRPKFPTEGREFGAADFCRRSRAKCSMQRNQYGLPTEPCDHVSELFRRSQTNRSGTCLRIFVVGVNSLLATCSPNAPGSSNNPTTWDYQLSHATLFNAPSP